MQTLQSQDNQIFTEGTGLFAGMWQELEAQNKLISDNMLPILAAKASSQ
jgi:hypothetical protein